MVAKEGLCYGCGTPRQESDLLTFTSKLAPEDVAYDDDDVEVRDAIHGGGARKKRRLIAEQLAKV